MSKIEENFKKQSLAGSFFLFLRKPNYIAKPSKNIRANSWSVFQLWSLAILIVILIGGPLNWIVGVSGYDDGQNLVWEFLQGSWLYVFLIAALLGPIMEEVSFRLFLRPYPFNLSFGFFMILFVVLIEVFDVQLFHFLKFDILNPFLVLFIIFSSIISLAFLASLVLKKRVDFKKVEALYLRKFPFIFYSASLIFAVLHIGNYYNLKNYLWLAILLVAPQIILSFFLGYVRMSYGFVWSVVFHIFHNGLLVSPIVLKGLLSENAKSALMDSNVMINKLSFSKMDEFVILFFVIFYLFISISFFIALWNVFRAKDSKNAGNISLD